VARAVVSNAGQPCRVAAVDAVGAAALKHIKHCEELNHNVVA